MKIGMLLAALVFAAGCGADGSGGSSQPRYDLTITYRPAGAGGGEQTATLTCDPDGGTHPDPGKACDALLQHEDALKPVPGDVACTEIYGGPQIATIVGGDVNASFSRSNGCQIARWDALRPVLELNSVAN
jgi:Subtilisin inhibitor-like